MFKAVCTNLAGFIEARFSLAPRIHILTNKRERQHATLKFVLNHCCNILTEAEVSGKNKTNVLSKTTNRHKEIAMFKIRPCLITRAAMPLPHNDVLRQRVKRDISLSFLFTTGGQNQDFSSYTYVALQ